MTIVLSRLYILFLILASLALFGVSPATRDYSIQSFSASDAAYHFYDDFPIQVQKPLFMFQCLLVLSLPLIYLASDRRRFQNRRGFEIAFYLAGGALIFAWWASSFLVIAGLFLLGYPWRDREVSRKQIRWTLAALFAVALLFRLEKLPNVMDRPLQPDSIQYVHYAQQATWFYDTNHREPLWAWINLGLSWIFPLPADLEQHGYPPIRIATILLSSLGVLAAFEFGRRWISHPAGFAAALLMAGNKALIYRSLQGLREELLVLLIFALLGFAWVKSDTQKENRRNTLFLGLSGALLLLLRTSCLPLVVFSFAWAAWSQRYSLPRILIASAICLAPAMPYYAYCWSKFGDPLYSGNAHIRFYYRALFGQYPPEDQRISPFQFMFRIFTWYESVFYTMAGILDTFVGRYALRLFYFPASVLWIGASAVEYARWIANPNQRIRIVILLLLLGPMAFFMGILIRCATVFDWRLVAHLFPFMAYAAAEGTFYLLQQAGWLPERSKEIE
jgi:hypothetical protein